MNKCRPFALKMAFLPFAIGCSVPTHANCFELAELSEFTNSGVCSAEGFLVKEFEDYFLEQTTGDRENFVIVDFLNAPELEATIELGERYQLSGRFLRLEKDIFRVEVDENSELLRLNTD